MSIHPLAGVVEKLRNADYHMHRLEGATLAYLNAAPDGSAAANASLRFERDADDPTRGRVRFHVLRQPPLELAAIAGDVIHNLRCTLEYIIRELVHAARQSATSQHQFPICSTPQQFTKARKDGRLEGINERAIRAIDGFQPYHMSAQACAQHPLLHLQKLSNRDKHRVLALNTLNAEFVWKFVGAGGKVFESDRTVECVYDGGMLAELPVNFVIDGEQVQLQAQLAIRVGFDEPTIVGSDVLGCLQRIRELIGQFMLPAFALFFEPLPSDLQLTSHGLTAPGKAVEMQLLFRGATLTDRTGKTTSTLSMVRSSPRLSE